MAMASQVCRSGEVRSVEGDHVKVLLEYDDTGQRKLCAIPRSYWDEGDVHIGQRLTVTWDPGSLSEGFQVDVCQPISDSPPSMRTVQKARELLGLNPGDKVLLVFGGNRPGPFSSLKKVLEESVNAEQRASVVRTIALKTAGWGEMMTSSYFERALHTIGIRHRDVTWKLGESSRHFAPVQFKDHHVIFFGSPKSNTILSEFYWDKLSFKRKYQFHEGSLSLTLREQTNGSGTPIEFHNRERLPDDFDESEEEIDIMDHFLLAKLPNPYAMPGRGRNCIVVAGVGTVATGYAGLVLGGQQSVKVLHYWFKDKPFEVVGKVEMKGWFDPQADAVHCVFDGKNKCNTLLLPNARISPQICDPEAPYTDEDFLKDMVDDPLPG